MQALPYQFNANCEKAYRHILALEFNEAERLLSTEAKSNPDNLIPPYLNNYIDFLKAFSTNDVTQYEKLKSTKEVRLERLKQGNANNPYHLYTQAEVQLQVAALDLKYGDYLSAIWAIRKSYKLLTENQQKHPAFIPNKKSLGVLYTLLGSVPDKYKWGLQLLGMEGSLPNGLQLLEEVYQHGKQKEFLFDTETTIIYALLQLHIADNKQAAWQTVQSLFNKKNEIGLLELYALAHVGVYSKHIADVLPLLEKFQDNPQQRQQFPYITYLHALAKTYKRDAGAATLYEDFLRTNKGQDHIKSSFQKLGWIALLNGDTLQYRMHLGKVENKGNSTTEADKQALREASTGAIPDVTLLEARLLFDGGDYQRAIDKLNAYKPANNELAIEKNYRLGRVYHEWGKTETAVTFYQSTIATGKNSNRYFAPNAAFECGRIYELLKDTVQAKQYYQLAMRFENHEYKNSIDQKSKAALQRLAK